MNKPAFRRDIQPIIILIRGRRMIRFHDPYQLADNGIAVDAAMLPLLQMLDGNHDVRDIQLMFMKQQSGRIVYLSEIESFVQGLDRACLLESEFFLDRLSRLKSEFMNLRIREPVHAGKAYPSEPDELGRFIEEVERELTEKQPGQAGDLRGQSITGILAPHIDVQVAREAYVNAFRRLRGRPYETVLVFGVNHLPQEGLYCLSEKDYATPFGNIQTDRDFIAELRKRVPEGTIDGNDFGHRTEHSIEFQTIFLHYYLGGSFSLIPILCGGVHEFLFRKENPLEDRRFLEMAKAMGNLLEKRKGPVLLVAGVDFSHVGHKFGDPMPADSLLPQSRAFEARMLSHIASGEPERIFEMAAENMDRFRVCGLPAILIFSTLLKRDRGELLCHETYDEKATGSAVNYASMVFTRKE
jgi:AmmeMemoRadiSam system protein B